MITTDYIEKNIQRLPECECWIWTGATNEYGYGKAHVGKKHLKAHRLVYAFYVSDIPDGKILMHTCDIRCCVNPAHLKLGTQRENMKDMSNKRRMNPVSLMNLKRPTDPVALSVK